MQETILQKFTQSAELTLAFAHKNWAKVKSVIHVCTGCLRAGNKIMIFGNGGSAADAQHIAAEFVNCLQKKWHARPALAALALTTDTSVLTSIGNDRDFSQIFSRQIEALGKHGDIAWAISTSGHSPNLIRAIRTARGMGITTIGMTGSGGGEMGSLVDHHLTVESNDTTRIQEVHITLAHIMCELIEEELLSHH